MNPLARLTRILGLSALLSLAALALFQDRLLYLPTPAPLAELVAGVAGARPWPTADALRALVVEPASPAQATIVVFHGNAGHAGHRAFYAEALVPLGWRVLLAEYPGYGPRAGEAGGETLIGDAAVTVALARQEFGEPLYLLGESLGAGVAAGASERLGHAGIAGLLLVTPWNSLDAVAAHHYPWLPRRLLATLLHERYDSTRRLAGFRGRVAVVLAENDTIVPASFGQALFAGVDTVKRRLPVAGADHNDWPDRVDTVWWRDVARWLLPPPPGNDPVD